MSNYNSINNYKQQAINTMSRGELLIKLFEHMLKNINVAVILMKENNFENADIALEKCKNILQYLCSILNNQYDVSGNLYQLYRFFNQEIIKASVKRDYNVLVQIIPIIEDLKNTWVQAEKLVHINKNN